MLFGKKVTFYEFHRFNTIFFSKRRLFFTIIFWLIQIFSRQVLQVPWVFLCLFMFDNSLNDFLHTSHWWFFSPVWVILCLFKSLLVLNFLSQIRQWNGRSSLWLAMCPFKLLTCFLQTLHSNVCFSCTMRWCVFKLVERPNLCKQMLHCYSYIS